MHTRNTRARQHPQPQTPHQEHTTPEPPLTGKM